jgi:hypothetical protein
MGLRKPFTSLALLTSFLLWMSAATRAEEVAPKDATKPADAKASAPKLDLNAKKEIPADIAQQALKNRFERFQKTVMQMAQQMQKNEPDRADLLFRALNVSQKERVVAQMKAIEAMLAKPDSELGESISRQETLIASLHLLLELLQSENRLSEIDAERARIKGILKDVNRLIGDEKDARAVTERGGNIDRAADKQADVEGKTKKLTDKIDGQDDAKRKEDENDGKPSDGKPSDGKPSDGKPSDGKPSDGKPSDGDKKDGDKKDGDKKDDDKKDGDKKDGDKKDGDKKDGDKKDGDKKPSDGKPSDGKPSDGKPSDGKPSDGKPSDGKPSDGKPSDGKPSDGKPSDGKPSESEPGQQQDEQKQDKTPGREELEKAREEMERAIDRLRKDRDANQASRHQDEAIRKLLEAKEKLEEILRQLREEERKLMLAALEARFRKMLGIQLMIYKDTVRLDKTNKKDETFLSRAQQLARNEEELVVDAQKALVLLRAEGSSVAFPQAVEAIKEDMQAIVKLLNEAKVGELTQTIEQAVIEALEEMVDALQQEMEKLEEEEKKEGKPQDQKEQDKPLVDDIAELKMLRSLQLRINRTTRRMGRQIEGEQADNPDILEQLQVLGRRQAKIQKATYDIATGRNK